MTLCDLPDALATDCILFDIITEYEVSCMVQKNSQTHMGIVDEIMNPSFQAENKTRTWRINIINLFHDIDTTTNMKGYTALLSKTSDLKGLSSWLIVKL